MSSGVYYADEPFDPTSISVTFISEKGTKLVKYFDSPYKGRQFANKIKRSKRCKLVACSGFIF